MAGMSLSDFMFNKSMKADEMVNICVLVTDGQLKKHAQLSIFKKLG